MSLRVLFTATPGTGHLHPLVPIARELVGRGHQVRWVTAAGSVERVASYGFEVVAGGVSLPERAKRFSASASLRGVAPRDLRPLLFKGLFAEIGAPTMREALGPVIDEFRPDVIVHEFSELAAAPLATSRGIAHVTVAFSGAPYAALFEPALSAMAAVWRAEGLDVPADLGCFDHLYLHPWPASLGGRPLSPNVVDSWHMGFDGSTGDPPPWVQGLGRDRPCVFVSFGTEMGHNAPWPNLLDALGQLDVDAVITTGQALDLSVHGSIAPNVRVETYVPQGYVLDRTSVVVSHTGANSVAAAIDRGLPQLCLPLGADQFDNADAVVRAGIGTMLETNDRSTDSVARAIMSLLADRTVHDRCDAVRAEVADMEQMPAVAERIAALA